MGAQPGQPAAWPGPPPLMPPRLMLLMPAAAATAAGCLAAWLPGCLAAWLGCWAAGRCPRQAILKGILRPPETRLFTDVLLQLPGCLPAQAVLLEKPSDVESFAMEFFTKAGHKAEWEKMNAK
eukprot:SAG22_NODE_244_length_14023_cov_45.200661_7_plen_123_part_00